MTYAYFFIDIWYIVLIVPAMILSLVIQSHLKKTYSKYSGVGVHCGMTGYDAAWNVMVSGGVNGVGVMPTEGTLTDHYSPNEAVIRLSQANYYGSSIAAVGVAAHEAGHAIQHSKSYLPLKLRNALVPVANFSAKISWWVFIAGIILGLEFLATAGIILFSLATVFHLVTLPVELDASKRAVQALKLSGRLSDTELAGVKKVLTAAALTYVASLATSFASLLRLILISRGSRRN